MVTLILFTSSYIEIGYLGSIQTSMLIANIDIAIFPCNICHFIELSYPCRGMKRRDLLLRRYWRREDDGTYGNSTVDHQKKKKKVKAILDPFGLENNFLWFILSQLYSITL